MTYARSNLRANICRHKYRTVEFYSRLNASKSSLQPLPFSNRLPKKWIHLMHIDVRLDAILNENAFRSLCHSGLSSRRWQVPKATRLTALRAALPHRWPIWGEREGSGSSKIPPSIDLDQRNNGFVSLSRGRRCNLNVSAVCRSIGNYS